MLDQEFEGPPPLYTEFEDERGIVQDMDIHAVGTQVTYGRDREWYGPRRDWEVEYQYWQAADGEPLN